MVARLAVTGVGFQVFGQAQALQNIQDRGLNTAAYLGFQEQFFNELSILRNGTEGKNLGERGDGRMEIGSLGQLSSPATVAALLATQEIAL